jgi:GT2 family glycosyltransferase
MISVVIPTFNGRDTLDRLIPALLHQEYPVDEYEIIVVVDGSSDGTVEYLRSLKAGRVLRILEEPNCGPAVARNRGVAAAAGDLVLLLDDDNVVDGTLLGRHLRAHRDGALEVVFGPVLVASDSPNGLATDWMRISAERYVARLRREGGPRSQFEVWVYSNCSMPRELFLASGGYDERNAYQGEDDDFAIRLWQAGVRFRFEPEMVTYHLYTKTIDELVRDYGVRAATSELYLCAKHPDYRLHSSLGAWLRGPLLKRWIYGVMCCGVPNLSAVSLRAATTILDSFRWIPFARSLGVRVLGLRIGVTRVTTAISELGSFARFRHELGIQNDT